jgi:hypothetical protein
MPMLGVQNLGQSTRRSCRWDNRGVLPAASERDGTCRTSQSLLRLNRPSKKM